jgi:glycosyltransferase involved in cell wall biosynthesis
MVPYKGYDFLLKCFNDLPYELTMVGDGPLRNELMKHAPKNVTFVGEVSEEEKFRLFREHDALIVSSINRSEAYGMTIVEAFSSGLPVIASDIDTGVTFLVRGGLTGLTYPILSASGLTEQVHRMGSNQALREELGKNCRHFFEEQLSYPAFKKNVFEFLSTT